MQAGRTPRLADSTNVAQQSHLCGCWVSQTTSRLCLLDTHLSLSPPSAIPFVGDVILGIWKANSRNAALLEEFLRVRGAEFLKLEAARVEDGMSALYLAPLFRALTSTLFAESVVKPGAGREKGEKVEGKAKGNLKSAVDVVLASTPPKQ